jgi:hypothetical protein
MDADVDARERDRRGQEEEERRGAVEQVAEENRPGEARRSMAGGHRLPHGGPQQWVGGRDGLERTRTIGERLQDEGQEIRRPDAGGGEGEREEHRLAAETRDQGREGDPDQA